MIHKHSHHHYLRDSIHMVMDGLINFNSDIQYMCKNIAQFSWKFAWLVIYAAFYISILAVIGLILFSSLISAL